MTISAPAIASDDQDVPQLVIIPIECMQFAPIVGDPTSATGWNNVLSFAGCIQDASALRVDRADELDALVEQMEEALEPSLAYYAAAIEYGPGPVKLRAAYQVGSGLVALITRARASIVAPADLAMPATAVRYHELHARLEPLLEPHAKLAWLIFVAIEHAVGSDPELASDVVMSNMVRSARELAVQLGTSLSALPDETEPRRTVWPTFMSSILTSKSQIAGSPN